MAKVKKKARKLLREKAWAVANSVNERLIQRHYSTPGHYGDFLLVAVARTLASAENVKRSTFTPSQMRIIPVEIRELPAKKAGGRKKP